MTDINDITQTRNKLLGFKKELEDEILEIEKQISNCKDYMQISELREEIIENRMRIGQIETQMKETEECLKTYGVNVEETTDNNKRAK